MGEPGYGNVKKLAWGSLWELTLFCERPTHHPFSCQILSFFSLTQAPPSKTSLVHKKIFQIQAMYLYLPTAMIIYYTVFHVGWQSSVNCKAFSSFRKQMLLCWLSGKLHFRGNRTRKRVLQKVQRVCGVELTCIKKLFLHLKYPAGRESDYAELYTLSSSLNENLQCRLVQWKNRCYSSPAGVDMWS